MMTNPENKTVTAQDEASWKTGLVATFSVVVLSGLSVAGILYSDDMNGRKGAKIMDETAKTLFSAQGYDVLKRKSYKAFATKETTQGETAIYTLKREETGEKVEGTLICGRPTLPDMVTPRTCYVRLPEPK